MVRVTRHMIDILPVLILQDMGGCSMVTSKIKVFGETTHHDDIRPYSIKGEFDA